MESIILKIRGKQQARYRKMSGNSPSIDWIKQDLENCRVQVMLCKEQLDSLAMLSKENETLLKTNQKNFDELTNDMAKLSTSINACQAYADQMEKNKKQKTTK